MIALKKVHIGQVIKEEFDKANMSKSEFARKIGIPQQHINKLFDKESIDTDRLAKICEILNYNFFALYCEFPTQVSAYLSAVAMGNGDAKNCIGDTALLSQLEMLKVELSAAQKTESDLRDQINSHKDTIAQLKDFLSILKEKK